MKQIVARIKAEESKFGKFLSKWIAGFFGLCAAIGALSDGLSAYVTLIPSDMLPAWFKQTIFWAAVISFVAGKLTKKKEDKPSEVDPNG